MAPSRDQFPQGMKPSDSPQGRKPLRFASFVALGRQAWHAGLDFLFPPVCAGCERLGWALCPTCAQAVTPTPPTVCARCGRVFTRPTAACPPCRAGALDALIAVRGAALFKTPLRQAIHAFKYKGRTELAEPLARYLVVVFAQEPWLRLGPRLDAVVPVPLHAQRAAERGYNQSELLAHAFASRAGLPCAPDWITRIRFTRPQIGLDAPSRQANVADAFAASPLVRGKTILLIDDVFTTGATLQACAQAAREAGAHSVYGLTLAAAGGLGAEPNDGPSAPQM